MKPMTQDYDEVTIDGVKYDAIICNYYDGPLDYYIKVIDTYIRVINEERTQWALIEGYGDISSIHESEEDVFSKYDWEAYQNTKDEEGKFYWDRFIPMDKKDLDWGEE